MEELIALLKFAIVNEDKFTEWDPDLVKRQWIEAAKKAVEAAQQGGDYCTCERFEPCNEVSKLCRHCGKPKSAQQGGHKDETCESCKLQYTSSCPSPRGERCQYFQPRR